MFGRLGFTRRVMSERLRRHVESRARMIQKEKTIDVTPGTGVVNRKRAGCTRGDDTAERDFPTVTNRCETRELVCVCVCLCGTTLQCVAVATQNALIVGRLILPKEAKSTKGGHKRVEERENG